MEFRVDFAVNTLQYEYVAFFAKTLICLKIRLADTLPGLKPVGFKFKPTHANRLKPEEYGYWRPTLNKTRTYILNKTKTYIYLGQVLQIKQKHTFKLWRATLNEIKTDIWTLTCNFKQDENLH